MFIPDGKAIQKTVLLTMKSVSTPDGFEAAERAVEIGCIKSSIQTKKVLLGSFIPGIEILDGLQCPEILFLV